MKVKQGLATKIVADFHGEAAAKRAQEDWSKMFQEGEIPPSVEEIRIKVEDVLPVPFDQVEWTAGEEMGGIIHLGGPNYPGIRLDKLLVLCGLAKSATEAQQKLKERAVRIGDNIEEGARILLTELPARLPIRVGKRAKIAVIYKQ
jgi:tyrosyl-tRNA synthetase